MTAGLSEGNQGHQPAVGVRIAAPRSWASGPSPIEGVLARLTCKDVVLCEASRRLVCDSRELVLQCLEVKTPGREELGLSSLPQVRRPALNPAVALPSGAHFSASLGLGFSIYRMGIKHSLHGKATWKIIIATRTVINAVWRLIQNNESFRSQLYVTSWRPFTSPRPGWEPRQGCSQRPIAPYWMIHTCNYT